MVPRILLTGGTGFFGRALLRYLLSSGLHSDTRVCVLSRNPQRFQSTYPELTVAKHISFVQGDIENRDTLPWDQCFTHVLHAATDSTLGPLLTPLQRYNQIVVGTTNLLDFAVKSRVDRFLLTSSGGIYGPQPADLLSIPEDWPGSPSLQNPTSAYSQGKRAAEHLCALYRDQYGLKTVVARCFTFLGPDLPLNEHFAVGNFIRDALYADAITVSGDGSPLRTYLDQQDLAHWLWSLLFYGHDGSTYNVGSNRVISISQLAYLIQDLIAPNKPVRILDQPNLPANRARYVPNIRKIQELHGLSPKVNLEQAIATMAAAYLRSTD